jgi:uncharacterized protein
MAQRKKFNASAARLDQEALERHFFELVAKGKPADVADFVRDHPGAVRWRHITSKDPLRVGENALHVAARRGDLDVTKELVNAGAAVNMPDGLDQTPLMHAAQFGRTDVMALLLKNGADPAFSMTEGTTALMFAARNGPLESAQLLLDNGADVNQTDESGDTALFFAIHMEDESDACGMMRLLLERGARLDMRNADGFTVIEFAREEGKRDQASFIEDYAEQIEQAQEWEAEQARKRDIDMMKTGTPVPFSVHRPLTLKRHRPPRR